MSKRLTRTNLIANIEESSEMALTITKRTLDASAIISLLHNEADLFCLPGCGGFVKRYLNEVNQRIADIRTTASAIQWMPTTADEDSEA